MRRTISYRRMIGFACRYSLADRANYLITRQVLRLIFRSVFGALLRPLFRLVFKQILDSSSEARLNEAHRWWRIRQPSAHSRPGSSAQGLPSLRRARVPWCTTHCISECSVVLLAWRGRRAKLHKLLRIYNLCITTKVWQEVRQMWLEELEEKFSR